MKKRIVFLMCLCFLATPMLAAEPTCNGGLTITANNGTTFCRSDKEMNWWSAFTWCESQNRKLADFATMCPGVSQVPADKEGACPNLQGRPGNGVKLWSSLAYDSRTALVVILSSGAVNSYSRYGTNGFYALCE